VSELAERAIAAHGGLALWQGASEIRAQLSSGGFAFASKLQGGAVRDVQARISTGAQHVVFEPYPQAGQRGVLEQGGTVRIETDAGELIASRENPRSAFANLRHKLWWDSLDILYFGAYAMWTYTSTPFVFAQDDYELVELDSWDEHGERWQRLAVRFPEHIHTHCREQVFYIGESGLIRRHDYTAEPFGDWAKAAHYCFDHQSFEGFIAPTRRRVYPRKRSNLPRAHPLLVWIEVPTATIQRRSSGSD
jgi:hypothetical protein